MSKVSNFIEMVSWNGSFKFLLKRNILIEQEMYSMYIHRWGQGSKSRDEIVDGEFDEKSQDKFAAKGDVLSSSLEPKFLNFSSKWVLKVSVASVESSMEPSPNVNQFTVQSATCEMSKVQPRLSTFHCVQLVISTHFPSVLSLATFDEPKFRKFNSPRQQSPSVNCSGRRSFSSFFTSPGVCFIYPSFRAKIIKREKRRSVRFAMFNHITINKSRVTRKCNLKQTCPSQLV